MNLVSVDLGKKYSQHKNINIQVLNKISVIKKEK